MQVTKTVEETRKQIKAWKKEGKTIGLVPTMGFLHEGHASLIKKCREQNDIVVVSDFVNPTQFGPTEDLEAYPRDFERDSKLCESLGTDLIFCPEPSEMYHDPHAFVSIDTLSETLCGKTRPIHFKGVCTVVTKLFHIVAPDRAYFGQKDAQQLAIIRKMVQDLNFDIEIVEQHHNQKIDAPSGTALMLADAIAEEFDKPMKYEYDRHSKREKRTKDEIGIHSVRGGTIVGEHEIIFAGRDEIITLSHSARSKEIFAVGAVNAAVYVLSLIHI